MDSAGSLPRILVRSTKKPRPSSRCFRVDEVGRGCAKFDPDSNREPGFFVIGIEKFFSFRPDWHQDNRANPLVQQHQAALDSVLQSHPELRDCAVHCVHCGIRFLTHPRNVGRENLRCPFGCRAHHRRQRSNERSAAYYGTPQGKREKKRLNGRRQRGSSGTRRKDGEPRPDEPIAPPGSGDNSLPGELPPKAELRLETVVLDESSVVNSPLLPYVRMVVSLIEGVEFSCRQISDLLCRAVRQHSIASRSRREYVLRFLHQHPP